jgi:hypothetical protein
LKDRLLIGNGVEIMQSIVDDIMNMLSSGNHISAISKSVGGNETAVTSALNMGLPLVLGALANHASKPGGTEMLTQTLTQAGNANPMDNMSGLLVNPATAGVSGIASTLLGSQGGTIQNAISQKTGLPPVAVSQVMAIAVPLIMGHVGKMFVQQKVDPKSLSGVLTDHSIAALNSSPEAAAIAQQLPAAQDSVDSISGMLKKLVEK